MTKRIIVALIAITLATPLHADFARIARALDSELGSRTWIPFLGLGRFIVKAIHPNGVHDFQLAVFENHRRDVDPMALEALMREGAGKGFSQLVRVRSNRSGENVLVYAKPRGRYIEMLVLAHEKRETVFVRVVADAKVVAREFGGPRGLVSANLSAVREHRTERQSRRRDWRTD